MEPLPFQLEIVRITSNQVNVPVSKDRMGIMLIVNLAESESKLNFTYQHEE